MRQGSIQATLGRVGLNVLTVVAVLFFVLPLIWMVSTALKPPAEVLASPPQLIPTNPTLDNFKSALTPEFLRSLGNSMIVAGGTTIVILPLALAASFAYTRKKFFGRGSLLVLILLTQLLPGAVIIVPLYRMMQTLHLLDSYVGLIVAYTTFVLPVAIWMLNGFLASVPREVEEASFVDGASPVRSFWSVTMPMVAPGVAATGTFLFIVAWQELMFALVMISDNEMRTIPAFMLGFIGEHQVAWGQLMAASIIFTAPTIVLFLLVQRRLVEGLTHGAVKG